MKNSYYIFRHAETFVTKKEKRHTGTPAQESYGEMVYAAEILSEGIPSIERMAYFLEEKVFHKFYTSEFLRCVQTSQIVENIIKKKFEKYSKLNEYIEENFEKFSDRMEDLIGTFEAESGKTYLLCTHGAVIAAMKHLLVDKKFIKQDLIDFPSPGNLVVIDNSGFYIKDFNQLN